MSAKRSRPAKQPRAAVTVPLGKRPAAVVPPSNESTSRLRLSWRFGGADPDGPWSLTNCSGATLQDIISKMASFESMRVSEMLGDTFKSYVVEEMRNRQAQKRLVDLNLDDLTELYRLRLSGAARLYGWLDDAAVFHVVWWDPKHEVWPSVKRNT